MGEVVQFTRTQTTQVCIYRNHPSGVSGIQKWNEMPMNEWNVP